jgi:acyl-coenzyme A synthetase/AMP-(fatty) acid ligase
LIIGGSQVGLGYKNLELKTRKVFLYDPYSNDGSSKMYNSGDQAKLLETGEVMYLGRNDDQVKINGQRVELGAVESGLLSCDGVNGCAVLINKTELGGVMLIGFVVCEGGNKIESSKRV